MTTLANIAPICAIIGFILIIIKIFVPRNIKMIMCVHVMFLSVIAAGLYTVRQFVDASDAVPPILLGVCWVAIGVLNYVEYNNHKSHMRR